MKQEENTDRNCLTFSIHPHPHKLKPVRDSVTQGQLLERLIREEDARILETIDYNSKEWNDYFGPQNAPASPDQGACGHVPDLDGRESIPPEQLLKASLLQIIYGYVRN